MAEVAALFAVRKLGDLVIPTVVFVRGVEEKVEWLKGQLGRIQSFLRGAAENQAVNGAVGKWISDIRDVALHSGDVIDIFNLKVDDPRRSRGLLENCACFPIQVYRLYCLGQQIEFIKRRLNELEASRRLLQIQSVNEETSSSWRSNPVERRRQVPYWQVDKHVVGLEEDVQKLRNFVLGEVEGLSVASISGMPGIGKSTLAQKVYNDAAVAQKFERRAWVCVSRDFRRQELMKDLVLQLQRGEDKEKVLNIMKNTTEQDRRSMVHDLLQGKLYFIVVDDVWKVGDWEELATLFPVEQDKASRILMTSRYTTIPRGPDCFHKMEGLDVNNSWQLFMKMAFGDRNDGECPPPLEDTAKKILKKCGGLPLAIRVVGGLLFEQEPSYSRWESFFNRMDSYMIGNDDPVSAVAELSYHDLTAHLKACFLCLSFFKEDVSIRATKLVQIWIAEGIVPRDGEETMEDKAWSYLDELIKRNMIQVKDLSKGVGRVESCQVHDVLRDLSIKKAKEEIKFGMLRERIDSESSDDFRRFADEFRHCAVYCNDERIPNQHLRTLIFYEHDRILLDCLKRFELLRVLVMEGLGLEILPESIGSLIGLKYLGLSENKISSLPKSLGQLRKLQVLDLSEKCTVPDIIREMYSLRHLYMRYYIYCEERLKLDTLKNLQTLSIINSEAIMIEHLSHLKNLRELEIDFGPDFNGWDWLDSLKHLVKLRIGGRRVSELPSGVERFPPNLFLA